MIREEMMSRMSAQEFHDWQMFFAMEPFGDRIVGSTLFNIHRGKEDKAVMPFEYLTQIGKEPQVTLRTAQQLHESFLAFKEAYEAKKAKKLVS